MEQGLETGELAPHFSLLAAGSARRVGLRAEVGGRVVLVFHLQGTAPTAREINRAVRARPTDPEDVLVASVIDLSIVPPVYWIYVSLIPNQAYDRATDELPPGVDPSECLVIPSRTGMAASAAPTAPGTPAGLRPSSWTRVRTSPSPTRESVP